MKSYQQLFAELKRRSVFKVAAVYGAVAFGLIQVADPLGQYLRLPETFGAFVVALLILAFPVALVLAWAFELSPQGVRKIEPAAPGELEAIMAQPLSKRWPSGLLALVGLALLVGGAWWAGVRTGRSEATGRAPNPTSESSPRLTFVDAAEDPRPSLAVLSFEDLSPEGDQEYFSDGITEEISNTLARIRELRVAARSSAYAFKGRRLDLRAVGDSLGVEYLVEGSVRKAGDRLRITAQLIDGEDGSHVWSEQYDRELDDVFAIQSEIAEAIAEELRVPLGLSDRQQLVSPTEDLEGYDLYLAARAQMRQRGDHVLEATALFEAALARDSGWAPAWAGLAESRALLPYYTAAPPDSATWARSLEAAERAAERALALDPRNASAAVALGNIHRDRWEWDAAEAAYTRALSLDPDNFEAHQQYAEFLAYVGRLDEAYEAALRALALDRSAIRLNVAGYIARHNGLYDEAAEYMDAGIALDPEGNVSFLLRNRALVHFAVGEPRQGRDVYLEWLRVMSRPLHDSVMEAWPASEPRPTPRASELVAGWNRLKGAELWMLVGDHQRALQALEEHVRDDPPFGEVVELWQPPFDPLRGSARFDAILRAKNLGGQTLRRVANPTGDGGDGGPG